MTLAPFVTLRPLLLVAAFIANLLAIQLSEAAENGIALTPPLGWTSWSSLETRIDEATIKAIADVQASRLKPAGYVYVNVDGGWYRNPDSGVDAYGRWIADPDKFPSGMRVLGDYIHRLGLKFGVYVTPGIPGIAVSSNTPVEGTVYRARDIADVARTEVTYLGGTMYALDYTKPGAQEFVNSWANLFASWGVDYLKLDAVRNENIPDVIAWAKALKQTGRSIHLALSNNLDAGRVDIWRQYSNGWRISTDIESYNGKTLTNWTNVALRFRLAPYWLRAGGPGGWSDLDSLTIAGARSGLTEEERVTMMTFWVLSASPLMIGDDLRQMDDLGLRLLTNPEVLKAHQRGVVAAPLSTAGPRQVWTALQPDGSYLVGLFNLGETSSSVEAVWSDVGFSGGAAVRDLWRGRNLGCYPDSFRAELNSHASKLLQVRPISSVSQRLADTAFPQGGASLTTSTVGARGQRAQMIGGDGTLTFPYVEAARSRSYDLTINYINGDETPRTAVLDVNGAQYGFLTFRGAGDWGSALTIQGVTSRVSLVRGTNTVIIKNPKGMAPDIVGVTLQLPYSEKQKYFCADGSGDAENTAERVR